jgi:hypothetical protein
VRPTARSLRAPHDAQEAWLALSFPSFYEIVVDSIVTFNYTVASAACAGGAGYSACATTFSFSTNDDGAPCGDSPGLPPVDAVVAAAAAAGGDWRAVLRDVLGPAWLGAAGTGRGEAGA